MATSTWQSSACDRCGRDVHRGVRCDCLAPYRVYSYQASEPNPHATNWTTRDPAGSKREAERFAADYRADGFQTRVVDARYASLTCAHGWFKGQCCDEENWA